ncbi:alpha/beta hydrolase family protein [Marinicella sp. W31]|uniref:alpha/beta hydrolase family protein n=1 Tax=Marinicella sp. W31 TaxID=3023713 RepID=UPI00375645F1
MKNNSLLNCVALILLFLSSSIAFATSHFETEEFYFVTSNNEKLSGIISRPKEFDAKSIIMVAHSYGATNVVEGNQYHNFRSQLTSKGITVVIWDKPGCGKSEGEFDINQPVKSSAIEISNAIKYLRQENEPGSDQIGIWGSSRGGWIAPLAINEEQSNIKFWISVSGTDAYENWDYLIRSSLEIEGYSKPEIDKIYGSLVDGNRLFWNGGDYDEYLKAIKLYKQNETVQRITGEKYVELVPGSKAYESDRTLYYQNRKKWLSNGYSFDEEAGLVVVVKDFENILSSFSIPVLAIFGGKDKNVDWRSTKALYEKTMGSNLTVKIYEKADHALKLSETGGYLESQEKSYQKYPYVDDYYEVMLGWLCANEFCQDSL